MRAWTDTNGHYELKTWYEEHTIAASAPGYETKLATLLTKAFGRETEARLDFQLQPTNASGGLVFGPVIEHVLNDPDDDTRNSFMDLDTGKVFDCPVEWPVNRMTNASPFEAGIRFGLTMGAAESLLRAVRERKIDLQSDASGNSLTAYDMAVVAVPNEQFNTSAEAVAQSWQPASPEPVEGYAPLHATNVPATWLFKTREGGMGVLQVAGFTEKPRGVKLRYKLVQTNALVSATQEKVLTTEQLARGDAGWFLAGSHPKDYETSTDRNITHSGKPSAI